MARSVFLVLLLLAGLILSSAAQQQDAIENGNSSNGEEVQVLLEFRKCIKADPSGLLDKWALRRSPVCGWPGIACRHGRVRALNLSGLGLEGAISPQIAALRHLAVLDLQTNNLSGSIPSELGNCTSLQGLFLASNLLTGAIPHSLGNLHRLRGLHLHENLLHGSIPPSLGNCSLLTDLELAKNGLTGSIPEALGRLEMLQSLYLFENRLTGRIPEQIGGLTRLEELILYSNKLSGSIPPSFGQLRSELLLYSNRLTGSLPQSLGRLTKLTTLSLYDNNLTGELPASLGNCSMLVDVELQMNNFSGGLPPSLALLGELQVFRMMSNRLSGPFPSALTNCTQLKVLDLGDNHFSGNVPEEIGSLVRLQQLQLYENEFSGPIPSSLGTLTELYHLAMSYNRLSGSIPDSFASLASIQGIYLHGNYLSGEVPFAALRRCLGNLHDLQVSFDLSHNSLAGPIPSWIKNMDKVLSISLASNSLSGEIPSSISDCKGLQSLDLSSNGLVGQIPEGLGTLKSLVTLDLSSNNLTGRIPKSLATLSGLSSLNVSMNNLQGPVPQEGVFLKLNLSSLGGNPGLCGERVKKACQDESSAASASKHRSMGKVGATLVISAAIFILVAALGWWFLLDRWRIKQLEVTGSRSPRMTFSPAGLKAYTASELSAMTDCFSEANLLGAGGFSKVYKGTNALNGETVAVKVLSSSCVDLKSFVSEVNMLDVLKHRNLVKVLGYCWTWEVKALVLEFMPNGSLASFAARNSHRLDWKIRLTIAEGIAQGLYYMHNQLKDPVIHCDLKPGNVLLDAGLSPHVADFGLSKLVHGENGETSVSAFKGTIGYAPPEYGTSYRVSTKGDVYSYGVVLLELLTGVAPSSECLRVRGQTLREWILDEGREDLCQVLDPALALVDTDHGVEIQNLVQVGLLCTAYNPSQRPSIKDVVAMLEQLNQ
ncbi:hypothetical protein SELMODRAFT_234577 [Selaginella moellendorffii]|uniref:Protein kinase domain-containing protein n=1 Tax=Selaginella moellendorffii TaxID=88036 RepID=D8SMM4_SELML|nr:hypothetical protein SELMODRAFT_234577 [Selaginella moellendorffii]